MNTLDLSRHAPALLWHRRSRVTDIDVILRCGSQIGDDVFFLCRQDDDREIRRIKREIQTLERLKHYKLVVAEDIRVTCYRSRSKDQKRMFRRSRAKN